ncbi:hypothetical protein [Nonomuraea sp. SBT364]|uniref:hypothetical protein n=1 Tax=Nonomuraea sp. SBT364 TaxID=1580530 RepID=UPI00066E46EA|nr:hypothetical protein [Nonomuraea sp. SBT364]
MAKMLYSATMSLDGFIAGPGGDMSWPTPYLGPNPRADELIERAGQALAAGLLDEVLVFVAPVMPGDGVRLFQQPGGAPSRMAWPEPAGGAGSPGRSGARGGSEVA